MFLIGATSMHPSENARRAALAQQAPPDEREGILVDTSAARRAQLASGALLLVWSIAFLWAFWEVQAEPRMGWRLLLLFVLGMIPTLFWWLVWFVSYLLEPGSGVMVLAMGGLKVVIPLLAILAGALLTFLGVAAGFWILVGGVPLLIAGKLLGGSRKLIIETSHALRAHDFQDVVDRTEAEMKRAQDNVLLRHNHAFCLHMIGREDDARVEYDDICERWPRFDISFNARALLAMTRDAQEGRKLAEEAAARFPKVFGLRWLAARAALGTNDVAGARVHADRAFALRPKDGQVLAIRTEVRFREGGDEDEIRALLVDALAQAPGDAYVLTVRARVAIRSSWGEAAAWLEEAQEASAASPLAVLDQELRKLSDAVSPGHASS
ncbi:MAG: hypothetical protein CMJ83_22515 [Planctomycetes bacterium]|nr:hypothetical protein [Planctomycetota bacterium]